MAAGNDTRRIRIQIKSEVKSDQATFHLNDYTQAVTFVDIQDMAVYHDLEIKPITPSNTLYYLPRLNAPPRVIEITVFVVQLVLLFVPRQNADDTTCLQMYLQI